jgi:hypothetical protein
MVSFLGVLTADNSPLDPTDTQGDVPVYSLVFGTGFILVVETKRGDSQMSPGVSSYEPNGVPDLQIVSSNPLGNGSPEVCDAMPPNAGGVPAVESSAFEDVEAVRDQLNDFGCRFVDGRGNRVARFCSEGCVRFQTGEQGCKSEATHQFCAVVDAPLAFPPGDTLITARVLDVQGTPGPLKQMIVRVGPLGG